MRLVRSWPHRPVDPEQPRVLDAAPRVYNDDYDYKCLRDVGEDMVHLDWDIAVSREDLVTFAERARKHPDRVLVGPYRIYPCSHPGLSEPVWAARRYLTGHQSMRQIVTGEPSCHVFGFGMVYLPHALVVRFMDECAELIARPRGFNDISFSSWHHRAVEPEAEICWDVRPVHLHYRADQVSL